MINLFGLSFQEWMSNFLGADIPKNMGGKSKGSVIKDMEQK